MLDPVRDAHLKAAAESLAQSVFAFLQTCSQAAAALNSSVITAQAVHGPLPVHVPLIPLPPGAAPGLQDLLFSTPVKQPPLGAAPWSPLDLFQPHLSPLGFGGSMAPATGATSRRKQRRRGDGGQHSPPKLPPPLFDAAPGAAGLAQHPANCGLLHWKSEVSANLAALGAMPNGLTGAAGSPVTSPRVAALMAAAAAHQEEEAGQSQQPQPPRQQQQQQQPNGLVRLTSNLSSIGQAEALGVTRQTSDLADLAHMAESLAAAQAAAQGEPATAGGEPAAAAGAATGAVAAPREQQQPEVNSRAGGEEAEAEQGAQAPAADQAELQAPVGAKRASDGSGEEQEEPAAKRRCAGSSSPPAGTPEQEVRDAEGTPASPSVAAEEREQR